LSIPNGVAVDSSGNTYVADTGNNVIREIVASSSEIKTVAGTGTSGYSGDNGKSTSAKLNSPYGVALDSSGDIYIADTGNDIIRKDTIK
jgi:sugar lactone lactonase YvrE